MNPLLIGFRAITTIMAAVFLIDGASEPDEIRIEDSSEWPVASHALLTGNAKTVLKLENQYGHQVKIDCKTYQVLCDFVRKEGSSQLRVWVTELGEFKSPSLVKATAGDTELVSWSSIQQRYEAAAGWRNGVRLFWLALAVLAWRQPLLRAFRGSSAA